MLRPIAFFLIFLLISLRPAGAHAADEIVLGAATSLTTLEGRESFNAVKMAVDHINAQGGIRIGQERHPLRIVAQDLQEVTDNVSVAESVRRLEDLIVQQKVHAVVAGPFRSEVLLAAMDVIARHRVPLLGAIAMSPASEAKILKDRAHRYIFRIGLNSKYLVEYLINTMKFLKHQYGFQRVYIINQDVAWARSTASLMVRLYFDRSDWSIVGVDTYATGDTDFSKGLLSAENNGAQVILPIFDMTESRHLVEQWHASKSKALLCGFISPMVGPASWETFQGNIAGSLNVIFELGNIPSDRWKPAADFHEKYRRAFGRDIQAGHGPAPAYESVFIFAEAVERAGSLDPEALVTALEATDRTGAMGRIRFHQGHQVVFGKDPQQEALACIFQWQRDGRRNIVYPLSIADGEIQLPVAP